MEWAASAGSRSATSLARRQSPAGAAAGASGARQSRWSRPTTWPRPQASWRTCSPTTPCTAAQLPKVGGARERTRCVVNGQHDRAQQAERDPSSKIPWAAHGVDVVHRLPPASFVHARGAWRCTVTAERRADATCSCARRARASTRRSSWASTRRVLDPVEATSLISCASCTTNALTPVLATLDKRLRPPLGPGRHDARVHPRARAWSTPCSAARTCAAVALAAVNIVPTSTGAAKAVAPGAAEPQSGKVDGTAVRVPVAERLALRPRRCTLEGAPEPRAACSRRCATRPPGRAAAAGSSTSANDALVSSDILGDPHSSIVDVDACMGIGAAGQDRRLVRQRVGATRPACSTCWRWSPARTRRRRPDLWSLSEETGAREAQREAPAAEGGRRLARFRNVRPSTTRSSCRGSGSPCEDPRPASARPLQVAAHGGTARAERKGRLARPTPCSPD
jgi:glyceraldehyde-3-phosphate dehydrogenase/erythrose-4-phosphate dehydrogenase